MSTPKGYKKLWKNIDWKNKEEKFAFYNRYFRNGEFVRNQINETLRKFKQDIIEFIKENPRIKIGTNRYRELEPKDILKYLEEK